MKFVITRRDPLRIDRELRELLLDYRLDSATIAHLNDWLLQLGEQPTGRIHQRIARIRDYAPYLDTPCEFFPSLILQDLERYADDELADLCRLLGLAVDGGRDARCRHILRAVLQREGWLPCETPVEVCRAHVQWHLVAFTSD